MRAFLALAFSLLSTAAFAHTGAGGSSGLWHGFVHPLHGLDHLLAMLAVGVLAFVLGGRALYLVPLSFVGTMIVGFLLGVGGTAIPFVELGIALSVVVIGGAAALGRPLPVAAAMALAGGFAIFHGHAHGTELPAASGGLDYALGFLATTAALHLAGIAAAAAVSRLLGSRGGAATRLAGGAFALGGVGILAGWL